MLCIYSNGKGCMILVKREGEMFLPDSEEMNQFCRSLRFEDCPRFRAYQMHLKNSSGRS